MSGALLRSYGWKPEGGKKFWRSMMQYGIVFVCESEIDKKNLATVPYTIQTTVWEKLHHNDISYS